MASPFSSLSSLWVLSMDDFQFPRDFILLISIRCEFNDSVRPTMNTVWLAISCLGYDIPENNNTFIMVLGIC